MLNALVRLVPRVPARVQAAGSTQIVTPKEPIYRQKP
jgi:hypothetical protein